MDALRGMGVEAYAFDGARADPGLDRAVEKAEAIVVSIPPRKGAGAALDRFASAIAAAPDLRRVVYYSTIGVYGDHGGAWVDETSPTRTRTARGLARLEDEARWTAAARARGVEADILRLAGIYGPGRNALINLREGQARRIVKPNQVFNRAHVDDIAEFTRLALTRGLEGQVWNVADDEPAPPQDVVAYAAALLGLPAAARGAVRRSAALPDDSRVLRRQQAGLDRQGQGDFGICPRLSDLPRGPASSCRGRRGPQRVSGRALTSRPPAVVMARRMEGGMEALSAIERIVRDLLVFVVAMSAILAALLVIISRMPDDNPLKRIMVALSYRVGATAAAGMLVIPATPIPGLDTVIDIGAPIALIWYWWTFFRDARRAGSRRPPA